METTQQQRDREMKAAVKEVTELLGEAKFFINLTLTEQGAQVAMMGERKELLLALLYSDTVGTSVLLEQITDIRNVLGEAVNQFLDIKKDPQYRMFETMLKIKAIAKKLNDKKDATRND